MTDLAFPDSTADATDATDAVDACLVRLLPPFARTAVRRFEGKRPGGCGVGDRDEPPRDGSWHHEERQAIAGVSTRRRQEFLLGRACAHGALQALGRDTGPVGVGPSRQPLWPHGVVGSISHSDSICVAATALATDAWALGVDVEPADPPLSAEVARLILRPDERVRDAAMAKFIFSAKEAVYKAIFPVTGWRLEFHDVAVELDLGAARFEARIDDRLRLAGGPGPVMTGGVAVVQAQIVTTLCLDQAGTPLGDGINRVGRRMARGAVPINELATASPPR